MKRIIVSSLAGAFILLLWSFLSWVVLPNHHWTYKYAPEQDSIKVTLDKYLDSDGMYRIPQADNRNIRWMDAKFKYDQYEMMKRNAGKSDAIILYHESQFTESSGIFIAGFLFNFFSVFFVSFILGLSAAHLKTFFSRFWFVLLFPLFIGLGSYLMQWNWMGYPWTYTRDFLLDLFIGWGFCGLWLAYYWRK